MIRNSLYAVKCLRMWLRKVQVTTETQQAQKQENLCDLQFRCVCEFRMHDGDLFINDNAMIFVWQQSDANGTRLRTHLAPCKATSASAED